MPDAPRILFAGGCHLTGFPVGAGLSLVSVALRQLNHPAAEHPEVLGYANLHSGEQIAAACRARNTQILVLQLGHYETLPKMKKMLHLGGTPTCSSSHPSTSAHPHPPPDTPEARFVPTLRIRTVFARRFALGWILRRIGLGHRVFDGPSLGMALDTLLSELDSLGLRTTVVLSPFSCPDPLTRSNRRQAAGLFAQAARRHGCLFLDAFALLEAFKGQDFYANFADPNHLSRLGHERIGQALAAVLRPAVT